MHDKIQSGNCLLSRNVMIKMYETTTFPLLETGKKLGISN